MAQDLFVLKLSDGQTTINFLSKRYQLEDGGFDIGLPQADRNLALVRAGFYLPVSAEYSYRECRLRFAVTGVTRSDVLSRLHTIEKVLRNIGNQSKGVSGSRGELQYAWKGANDVTYFEVYGGDIGFASDLLSVAKIHAVLDGEYFLPDVELRLFLSPYGFGLSIYEELSTADMEIPLMNTYSGGSYVKGGVQIKQPRTGNQNWVNIRGSDLKGTQPMICKIMLKTDSNAYRWNTMYIGCQHGPTYPSKTIFDGDDVYYYSYASAEDVTSSYAEGGKYRKYTFGQRNDFSVLPFCSWYLTKETKGMFHAFLHHGENAGNNFSYAIGVDDYVAWGMRYQEDFVTATNTRMCLPLGAIQLPPTHIDLASYADVDGNGKGSELDTPISLSMWVNCNSVGGGSFSMDYVSLMPIENGLRVLQSRMPGGRREAGTYVDDAWKGLEYFSFFDATANKNYVAGVIFGMMEPVRLDPGVDQRLYFLSFGNDTSLGMEKERSFYVRVFGVPTYLTLAM